MMIRTRNHSRLSMNATLQVAVFLIFRLTGGYLEPHVRGIERLGNLSEVYNE